jgi:AraC-like DNA-binding protein
MGQAKPLAKFPIVYTNRFDDAEVAITRSLVDSRIIRIADRNRFHFQMNGINIGRTSLVFNRFGSNSTIKTGEDGDMFAFVIGNSIPSTFDLGDGLFVASPHKATIITPPGQMQIERSEGSEILVIRTSMSDVVHHFEKLTDQHHRGSLVFNHSIDLTKGPGATLKRMMNYVVCELERNDALVENPALLKSYDDMLLTALLSLPHDQREELYEDCRFQVAPGLVHRAEEYIRAQLKEPITITDLLRICGCSRSLLFGAFKNTRGYTPMEFLTGQRLLSVREQLLKQHPDASVASIAMDCGFIHLGRFSQDYRKRFGERPSETLRKGGCINAKNLF